MKKISLTLKEFYIFKDIAMFFYNFSVIKDQVLIEADAHQLELLGY